MAEHSLLNANDIGPAMKGTSHMQRKIVDDANFDLRISVKSER